MSIRKSTKIWLAILAAAVLLISIDGAAERLGPLGDLAGIALVVACVVLVLRGVVATFRVVVRRLTLRLAFSYFLIGIVPIPLLALLLAITGYLLAFQFVGARLKRELVAVAQESSGRAPGVLAVEIREGKVVESPFAALPAGTAALWAAAAEPPRFIVNALVALSVVGLSATRAEDLKEVFAFSSGIAGALMVLTASAALLAFAARRALRKGWPYVVRQGVANLYRPGNQTRSVVLSLGFGAFLVTTLYLVQ